jgi:hypothetical protein
VDGLSAPSANDSFIEVQQQLKSTLPDTTGNTK